MSLQELFMTSFINEVQSIPITESVEIFHIKRTISKLVQRNNDKTKKYFASPGAQPWSKYIPNHTKNTTKTPIHQSIRNGIWESYPIQTFIKKINMSRMRSLFGIILFLISLRTIRPLRFKNHKKNISPQNSGNCDKNVETERGNSMQWV